MAHPATTSLAPPVVRAAQYLRMSTEHQRYSPGNQAVTIARYAEARGLEIVRTYLDEGVSGLRLSGRKALQQLLADVVSGQADYQIILTLDVSRWGRFQDIDESAHYEFLCRQAGIGVAYCAEPFENDGSTNSTIIKLLKRVMAAEYSRDLSVKIRSAKRRSAERGHWANGIAGYGLRRMIVDRHGTPVTVMQRGERKAVSDHHVILVPGPPEEVEVVRRIYRLFVITGLSRKAISRQLEAEGIPSEDGGPWSPTKVHRVLSSSKYAGDNIFGRSSYYLGRLQGRVDPERWVRLEGVFEPLVDRAMCEAAQRLIRHRIVKMTDEAMIRGLAELLKQRGRLTSEIINEARGLPCAEIYRRRFGGLLGAYARVDYQPSRKQALCSEVDHVGQPSYTRTGRGQGLSDEEVIERLKALLAEKGRLSITLIDNAPNLPNASNCAWRFDGMAALYRRVGYAPSQKQHLTLRPRDTHRVE